MYNSLKKKILSILMLLLASTIAFSACDKIGFKVSFIVDDEVYETVNIKDSGTIKMPDNPTKEGYVFDGWYLDEDVWEELFTENSFANEALISDISVYAKWNDAYSLGLDFEYHYNSYNSHTHYSVTGYTGTDTNILVPEKYNNIPVEAVSPNAFKDNKDIEEIIIGDAVKSIGKNTFYGCSSLRRVSLGKNSTVIGESAFENCANLEQVVWNSNVSIVRNRAFIGCTKLKEIYITEVCNSYHIDLITGCDSLEKITMPGYITLASLAGNNIDNISSTLKTVAISESSVKIVSNMFLDASMIITVIIPDSVTNIDWGAFSGCSKLANITIPDNVTIIEGEAFYNCKNITEITIPNKLTNIGIRAFSGTGYYENESNWQGDMFYIEKYLIEARKTINGDCIIKDGTTVIASSAFLNTDITGVTIPDSMITIGWGAFENCVNLLKVSIPTGITSIEGAVFRGCNNLTSIIIPDNITSIGYGSFENCINLEKITMPDSIISIGGEAFKECVNLKGVYINDITAWCNIDFDNFDSNPLYLANNLYLNDNLVTDLIIPDKIEKIGNYAFSGCGILSLDIPNGVTSIGERTFCWSENLQSVTISKNILSIGKSAFSECSSLMSFTLKATIPPFIDVFVFNNSPELKIFVPEASLEAYKATSNWSNYSARIYAIS